MRGRCGGVVGVLEDNECRPESFAPFERVRRKGSMLGMGCNWGEIEGRRSYEGGQKVCGGRWK